MAVVYPTQSIDTYGAMRTELSNIAYTADSLLSIHRVLANYIHYQAESERYAYRIDDNTAYLFPDGNELMKNTHIDITGADNDTLVGVVHRIRMQLIAQLTIVRLKIDHASLGPPAKWYINLYTVSDGADDLVAYKEGVARDWPWEVADPGEPFHDGGDFVVTGSTSRTAITTAITSILTYIGRMREAYFHMQNLYELTQTKAPFSAAPETYFDAVSDALLFDGTGNDGGGFAHWCRRKAIGLLMQLNLNMTSYS